MLRVALAIDQVDWHARALLAAFAAAGVEAVRLRLADCRFDSSLPFGLAVPGFGGENLPDAVLVRAISAGGFEAITRRLGVLHALRDLGVPVWNDARAIERCVDKSATTFLAARAGLPVPKTWAVEGIEAAKTVLAEQGGRLVLKPLFGQQGNGLRLVEHAGDLPPPSELGSVYYLQRYLEPGAEGFRDHRLFVVAGKVTAAMTRRAGHWVTNIRQGARAEKFVPDAEMADLAMRAAACVGADYAGVDLLRDRHGRLWLLEVNSMPGWRGLQRTQDFSIAQHVVDALLARLR